MGIYRMTDEEVVKTEIYMINNGWCSLGDADCQCRRCGRYSTTAWTKDNRSIKYVCVNCGANYFVPVSGKRTSTQLHKWSLAVRRRDGFMCRKCGSREKLNAHHVKPFADFPGLRFNINNGITLCEDCHKKEHKK